MLNKQYDKYKDPGAPALYEKDLNVVFFRKPKFQEERIAISNERYYLAMDGLILNKKRITSESNMESFEAACEHLLEIKGPQFIKELRGNFFGIIFDRLKKKAFLFVDHMGTKWLFYRHDSENGLLLFSNKLEAVAQSVASLGQPLKLDMYGAYSMLALGYMLENETLVQGIFKINPGTIREFSSYSSIEHRYYRVDNTNILSQKSKDIIDELDDRFKVCITDEFNKDIEYGYKHLATLSGGVDSRMVVGSAIRWGFRNMTTFTMSQSRYHDETISRKISEELGTEHKFISLNGGDYLLNIDEGAMYQEGLVLYSGSSHLLHALKNIDMSEYGIVHTGMVGDGVFGTFLVRPRQLKPVEENVEIDTSNKEYRAHFLNVYHSYENAEMFKIYAKVVNAVYNGYRTIEAFSEYSSAFFNVDFMDYAYRIPPELRYKKMIYKMWISKKSKNLTEYPLESSLGMSFDSPEIFVLTKRVIRKIRKICLGPSWNDSMNPMEYWYKTNNALRVGLQSYFDNHIEAIADHNELAEETRRVFSSESVPTKTKALTLLSVVRNLGLK